MTISRIDSTVERALLSYDLASSPPFSQVQLTESSDQTFPCSGKGALSDIFSSIWFFIRRHICRCLFFSSTTLPCEIPLPTQPVVGESSSVDPNPSTEEMLPEGYEGVERRIAALESYHPPFPIELSERAILNESEDGSPHYGRTNREAFDEMQGEYLRILSLMHSLFSSSLRAQRESGFHLGRERLGSLLQDHENYNFIMQFCHDRHGSGDIQFNDVFRIYPSLFSDIVDLQIF